MAKKPTYEELEKRIKELKKETVERKGTEDALLESQEYLKGILNSLYETAIVVLDREGNHLSVWGSKELDERYNINSAEMVGKSLRDIFPPQVAERMISDLHHVFETGESLHDEYIVHFLSGDFWHDVTFSPIRDQSGKISAIVGFIRDITARKQAEETLRESEERYRSLFEGAEDHIFVIDQDFRYVTANPSALKAGGFTLEDVVGKGPSEIFPEDKDFYLSRYRRVFETGQSVSFERKLRLPDGFHWFSVTLSPIKNVQGRVIALTGISRDVTERKQAEETLRESEERFRMVLESSMDNLYRRNLKTDTYDYLSPAVEHLSGYSVEEILSMSLESVMSMIHPDDIGKVKRILGEAMRSDRAAFLLEYRLRHKDGQYRWLSDLCTVVRDAQGHPLYLVGSVRDVTERKRAEAALRESKERYRDLYENAPNAYFSVSAVDGTILSCNNAAMQLLGYDKKTILGMRAIDLYAHTPDGFSKAKEVFKRFRTGESIRDVELKMKQKDGNPIWISLSVEPVRDRNGNVIESRSTVIDISERKRLEAQLRHTQRMEAMGTLTGGIAHNFNNLLMGIMGNVSIILSSIDPSHPHYRNLQNIKESIQSGSKLTKQLLGYAREERYEVKPVNLNQLVRETADTFSVTRKEVKVHQALAENLYAIKAELGQIEQVLLNLFVNAAEAMPGGGDLFFETRNVTHESIAAKGYKPKAGDYVLLTVRDTGVGMDNRTKERIFDPFFTTKGLAEGMGLGLASAYGIIKGHGGYIEVDSKKGQGTTFSIYIPASEEKVEK